MCRRLREIPAACLPALVLCVAISTRFQWRLTVGPAEAPFSPACVAPGLAPILHRFTAGSVPVPRPPKPPVALLPKTTTPVSGTRLRRVKAWLSSWVDGPPLRPCCLSTCGRSLLRLSPQAAPRSRVPCLYRARVLVCRTFSEWPEFRQQVGKDKARSGVRNSLFQSALVSRSRMLLCFPGCHVHHASALLFMPQGYHLNSHALLPFI